MRYQAVSADPDKRRMTEPMIYYLTDEGRDLFPWINTQKITNDDNDLLWLTLKDEIENIGRKVAESNGQCKIWLVY